MERVIIKKSKVTILTWVVLCGFLLAHFSLAFLLWKKTGEFFMLAGDDAGKAMTAYGFVEDLDFIEMSKTELPPVHPWIVGLGYKMYPDLLLVSSLVNTLFGLGVILVLFFLARKLFPHNDCIILLSVGFITFYPEFIWANLCFQRDSVVRFFILTGIFFWISYIKDKKRIFLLLSATAFLVSTATLYEGWFLTLVFIIFCIKESIVFYREHKRIDFSFIGCIFLSSLYVFWRLYWDYQRYGNPFGYLIVERNQYLYAWASRGFFERLFAYPFHLIEMAPWVFPVAVSMLFLPKRTGRLGWHYLIFVSFGFLVFIISALIQTGYDIHHAQAPLLLYLIAFLPMASFGIVYLLSKLKKKAQYTCIFFLVIMFAVINVPSSFNPPKSELRKQAIQTGLILRLLWQKGDMLPEDRVVLEERVDVADNKLSVECYMLRVFDPRRIISDREWKFVAKNETWTCTAEDNPSTLDLPSDALKAFLRKNGFRIVVVHSDKAAEKLSEIMTQVLKIEEYKFYLFPEDKDLANVIKSRAKQIPSPWLGR
ncbi:MAG: glycosyltransferase family 39 protein [Candidatus Omnitrophica bacterium]|nr:glycosyltransferase family 39 protein [Candidatus Omnitrophota bacterium]MBU1811380.1 glycosyltransferase family 39 protein [Candidatus Omnitrophota bacterium]